jgi:hypothetical protein
VEPGPPNGLELSCPAEAGKLPLIVAPASGPAAPTFGPARRVSFSELLGRPGAASGCGSGCASQELCEGLPPEHDEDRTYDGKDRPKGKGESPPEDGACWHEGECNDGTDLGAAPD